MNIFREMKWSADSQNLAIISGRLTGGGIELQAVNIYNVTASLDNQFYTFGNSDIAISNEIDISVATNNYPTPIEIAWHPFDPLLAISFNDRFEIYSIEQTTALFSETLEATNNLEWSPDGKFILFTSLESNQTSLWGIP
jgi:hypothetical protein